MLFRDAFSLLMLIFAAAVCCLRLPLLSLIGYAILLLMSRHSGYFIRVILSPPFSR